MKTPNAITDDIQKLLDKRAQIDAKINAKKARIAAAERKLDTRRKILIGAALMAERKDQGDEWWMSVVQPILERRLTQERDRSLFGLPDLPPPDK